jgi:hypothetical protein
MMTSIEEAIEGFVARGGVAAVVAYPRTRNHHLVGTHDATSAMRLPNGRVQVRTNERGAILRDAFDSLSVRTLTNQGPTFTWGTSRFLSATPETAMPTLHAAAVGRSPGLDHPPEWMYVVVDDLRNTLSCYTNGG